MPRILVVDNETNILSVLNTLLKAEGYDVLCCREGTKAKEILDKQEFDLMVSDIRMKPVDGMELLQHARKKHRGMAVIMLTAFGSVETAIEAMKLGAFDYVTKPFKVDELIITIQRALDYNRALMENLNLKSQIRYRFENIVAESPSMKEICEIIERVAPSETSILIYGESGTGKELVAKAIHANSNRKHSKFLAVNCAALPEPLLESEMFGHVKGAFTGASSNKSGLFEAVEDGTLFLDEIGSMPLSIQGKLLRVLQEKEIRRVGGNTNIPINARVLAATNINLENLIGEGLFREDLFYRLNVIPINISPLRERKEDIIPLAENIMKQELTPGTPLKKISPEARVILESYSWPGNVRELENALKHAMTFAPDDTITPAVLPAKIVNTAAGSLSASIEGSGNEIQFETLGNFLQKKEQEYINHILSVTNGNKEEAAGILRVSLATLYRKLPGGKNQKS